MFEKLSTSWELAKASAAALSGVYAAAVYRYAADGQANGFFTPAMIRSAFRAK